MLILSNEDIEKILPVGTCLDVLEEAYCDLGNGMAATAGGDKFVGLVMLFSTATGEPLAIFPDGYVQKLRVAGASAIAARYLAPEFCALRGSFAAWRCEFFCTAASDCHEKFDFLLTL